MRFELALARRYLRSPAGGLSKFTARLAVVGIAVGTAAMIFALSLSRGFREEVQEKLLLNTPHINVYNPDGIADVETVKNELSKIEGVEKAVAAENKSALLITASSNVYTVLRAREERQPERTNGCVAASFGAELAKKAGLEPGDMADAVFAAAHEGETKKFCLTIKDTFSTGIYEHDLTTVMLSLSDLRRETGESSSIEVSVANIYDSQKIATVIMGKLGDGFEVIDWQRANQPFFAAISFERRIVMIIISLVILLSALNITFTLALGVAQRCQDIAVLRTAGAKTRGILFAFLLEGMFLGAIGIVSGTLIGLAACWAANYFELIRLPGEVYVLNKIILRPDPLEVTLIVLLGFVVSVLATAYPAFSASRIKPWENLRL